MAESLKNRTVNGVVWSAIDRFSALGIQMICSLIVAHLLTPKDFGILGMIAVFSAIGMVLIDSGFGSALIRRNDATEIDYSSVFYFNIFISIISYIFLFYISPYIAYFYDIPELTTVCRITFLVIPINALGLIQNTRLIKNINFKSIAIVSLFSALMSGIAGIILAYYMRNVWALVIQNVSMYGLRTLLLWCISRWKPLLKFSMVSIKSMWKYSINLLGFGLIGSFTQNLYPLMIGKIYNATQLGYYSQADRLQKLPSTSITEVIQRVCFPVLSEIKDDIIRMREVYRKIIITTLFIIFPLMMLLIGISDELIIILMGAQWEQSIQYFKILCIVGALYPLHSINLNILNVVGKSNVSLKLEICRKTILIVFIIIFAQYSIVLFIWMQVIYSFIVLFINIFYSGREINYGIIDQIKDIIPTASLSIIPLILIILIGHIIQLENYIMLLVKTSLYCFIYLGSNYLLKTEAYSFAISSIRNIKL